MSLRVLDLYAGIGRCSEPFRQWDQVSETFLVDNNEYAKEVYLENFPGANYLLRNLAVTGVEEIKNICGGEIDILLGCPPCQGFSDCGSKNPDDPRNRQVSRFGNLINSLRPRAVVMENVPLTAASSKFQRVTKELECWGYKWVSTVTNAALWGSCQTRQRLILVAIHQDSLKSKLEFPSPTHGRAAKYFSYSRGQVCDLKGNESAILGDTPASKRSENYYAMDSSLQWGCKRIPTLKECLAGLPSVETTAADDLMHIPWQHVNSTLKKMKNVPEGSRLPGSPTYYSQSYGRLHRKGLARTITGFFANPGSGRFWHPTENRALTLREAARIQGLPDQFRFLEKPTENCVLVGNALDNALAEMAFKVVKSALQ